MTDGQWLFSLFLLLYLVECLRLQPSSAWLLAGNDRLSRPFFPLDFAGRHLILLPILPPFQAFANLRSWELVPCSTGLELFDTQNNQHHVLPWESLNPSVDGAKLILGAKQHLHCSHQSHANAWYERLLYWAGLSQAAREKDFLELASQAFNGESLRAEMRSIAGQTRPLRILGTLLFFTCFGVITVIYRRYGDGVEVLVAAGGLVALQWVQAVLFWYSSGRLRVPLRHRFWKALACAFLPQNAMRAADHLCEALSPMAHPLAAISAMPDAEKLKKLRPFWQSIQHSSAVSASLQQQALAIFLKTQNIHVDQLQEIPEKQAGSVAYCPQCSAQFRDAKARCKDCGDLQLKPF